MSSVALYQIRSGTPPGDQPKPKVALNKDGIPDFAEGFSARRDKKNDVDMMSNCQPSLRAIASAFGTLGCSM